MNKNFLNTSIRLTVLSLILVFIVACGGNKSKEVKNNGKDSVAAELAKLNDEIEKSPNNADLYNKRANYYVSKKEFDLALADVRQAMNIDSSKATFFLTLSDIYFAQGKATACQGALEKSIKLDPEFVEGYMKLAELNLYLKKYEKTYELLDKALEFDKLNAKAYFMRGMAQKEQGDTGKAVASFKMTIDQDPEYYHAFIELGLLYSIKHNKIALEYFNSAVRLNPTSVEAYYALGMFCQENDRLNDAIKAYTTIIKLEPKNKFAHYNLGYIHLVYLKVYDVAIKHFTNAIKADPNYAEAFYNRGYSFELLGDLSNAREDYKEALRLKVNYTRAIDG
ncbi:MAG: tetratricopeptide repeat protein, partial [Bacteroidetes bacterium]|nr:tetratricopeptide repeat protein [Bacteroidota bacterium]